MLVLGAVCGAGPHPHCGWCLGAASLVMAGLAAFAVAVRGPPGLHADLILRKAASPRPACTAR